MTCIKRVFVKTHSEMIITNFSAREQNSKDCFEGVMGWRKASTVYNVLIYMLMNYTYVKLIS